MSTRARYHYYTVDIPADHSEDPTEREHLAINIAHDAARLYIMPAVWYVLRDDGHTVRVCRKSRVRS